nr:N-acetyltransferase 10 [Cryptomonas paramecium]
MKLEKIKKLFLTCKIYHFRSIILAIGLNDKKIYYLYYIWCKYSSKKNTSILWCYKKNFQKNKPNPNINYFNKKSNFSNLLNIRYCYYNEVNKILGNTFGMCILQDFKFLTPNILAKTIETVEGGGLVLFLIKTTKNLDDIYHMSIDVYRNFKSESYRKITGRFCERFLFSLNSCSTFLAIDENLKNLFSTNHSNIQLKNLHDKTYSKSIYDKKAFFLLLKSVKNLKPFGKLIEKTKTFDQAKALLALVEAISDKKTKTKTILTSARGRGKSAVLGLATSAAVAYGYGNIYVSAVNPENLNIYFAFVLIGLKCLKYEENKHFQIIQDTKMKFIRKIKIYCTHEQNVIFLFPDEIEAFEKQIELLIIDEVASMPMRFLESLRESFLVFMSSTISGYEGTSHYFSFKVIKKLKKKFQDKNNLNENLSLVQEIKLNEPIRYSSYDPVEKWLNELLCLDNKLPSTLLQNCPNPNCCKLFLVDRNALVISSKFTNSFFQKIFTILTSSHYRNSPNDLQMLYDAPSHRILVLLNLLTFSIGIVPDIIGAIHVSYEGKISKKFSEKVLIKVIKTKGDLIPWVVSKHFMDSSFTEMSGLRIIRIAVHPDIQNMGYGSKIIKNLIFFLENAIYNGWHRYIGSQERMNKKKIPILINLEKRRPPRLNYIGVSFAISQQLFYFWNKNRFEVIFIENRKNENFNENTCIMLYCVKKKYLKSNWIKNYQLIFLENFLNDMIRMTAKYSSVLIFSIIQNVKFENLYQISCQIKIKNFFNNVDIYKMFLFAKNFFFEYKILADLFLKAIKVLIWNGFFSKNFLLSEIFLLISVGLQRKKISCVLREFDWKTKDIITLSKKILKKFIHIFIYNS